MRPIDQGSEPLEAGLFPTAQAAALFAAPTAALDQNQPDATEPLSALVAPGHFVQSQRSGCPAGSRQRPPLQPPQHLRRFSR